MKKLFLLLPVCCFTWELFAQNKTDGLKTFQEDSITEQELNEVIIIGNPGVDYFNKNKTLGSLDGYLEESNSINMIRRGAYAWEPMLNGMSTERSIITIDGMRIFHACTDKMDPVTSYVENTNLSRAKIEEGQSGSEFGGTIAGSINLIRKKSGFGFDKKLGGSVFTGFESNNKQQIYGATLSHSSERYFADIDFTYRNADNYKAGRKAGYNSEIEFSQFTKYNVSATTGFKINDKQEIEGTVIYDKATDIGYPGLPMDVSLAEAFITSLQYRYRNISDVFNLWETKAYFNTITHIMDDSHRPVVPIRMDMPGWSKTQGFYSKILGSYEKHYFKATISGYRNNSLAEMVMYPNNPNEKEMFMLTWPDVNTLYGGLSLEDNISFTPHLSLSIGGGLGVHYNEIKSELGLNSLQLFYPDLKPVKTRLLKNIYSYLSYHTGNFLHKIGFGYGDRAPTISEGYGFYLLNVNDNFDYIGNPKMKNEKSLNIDISSNFKKKKLSVKTKVNYFYIIDYIIGKPRLGIPPMNIMANGIKIYEQLNNVSIFNTGLEINYNLFSEWTFSTAASYRYGQGANNTVLPLIQPFSYKIKAVYEKNSFFAEASVEGSTKNRNSIEFGETQKTDFTIANVAMSKNFSFKGKNVIVKFGAENLFNRYYLTFDNWFDIPRMGRNIYANIVFKF